MSFFVSRFLFLLKILKTFKRNVIISSLLMLFAGLFESIGIIILLPLLNIAFKNQSEEQSRIVMYVDQIFNYLSINPTIEMLLIFILSLMLCKIILTFLTNLFVDISILRLVINFRKKILGIVFNSRWEYFITKPIGAISNLIGTEVLNASNVFYCACRIVSNAVQISIFLFMAMLIDFKITLFSITVGILVFLLISNLIRKAKESSKNQTKQMNSFITFLLDFIQGIKSIKSMNLISNSKLFLSTNLTKIFNSGKRLLFFKRIITGVQELVNVFVILLFLYLFINYGTLKNFEVLLILVILFYRCVQRINVFQNEWQRLAVAEYPYKFLNQFLEHGTKFKEKIYEKDKISSFKKNIYFKDINYKYGNQSEPKVLRNININIRKNKILCLYGRSGSGKTTLIDLITGLLTPESGSIIIDNKKVQNLSHPSWRNKIGYVSQDLFLFNDSLKNNILLGKKIDKKKLMFALKYSGVDEFLKDLSLGLETPVGERGNKFSGGQKQRISIARALYKNPEILILDEPTSALDLDTEKFLVKKISELKGMMTIIIISHTDSFFKISDQILKLEHGFLKKPDTKK